ncbi:MAG: ferredoxin family protein, partial [Gracilibacteraceae bacterium]|nr:ferredoxin family protein [Gracilibacteraceae bacterium]
PDPAEYHKLSLACPAGLYKIDEQGNFRFDYAGCFECGACRVLGGETVLDKWEFPSGGMGIEFRYG